MTLGPFHSIALTVLLACGTNIAGIHRPDKRHDKTLHQHRKAKRSCKQFSFESDRSVPLAKIKHSLHKKEIQYQSTCCKTCWMAEEDSPRLFIPYRQDGVGMRAMHMLHGMAIAAYNNMNFGGAIINQTHADYSHGKNNTQLLIQLFGEGRHLVLPNNTPMDYQFKNLRALEDHSAKISKNSGAHVFLSDPWLGNKCHGPRFLEFNNYATPQFLKNFRLQTYLRSRPLKYFKHGPSVAIHVRRGDIEKNDPHRYTKDTYYFQLVEILRQYLPNADIHVFSTIEKNRWTRKINWKKNDFDWYRRKNMTVHLNGDIFDDWAHMAAADVLIMAKSTFSFIPAFINKKCVVFQDFCYEPLSGWTNGQYVLHDQTVLKKCLAGNAHQHNSLALGTTGGL